MIKMWFHCANCGYEWEAETLTPCPKCGSEYTAKMCECIIGLVRD